MGDRTWAQTAFRREYFPIVTAALGSPEGINSYGIADFISQQKYWDDGIAAVEDDQANYGNMDWITGVLQSLSIPYDLRWDSGSEYGAGGCYVRYDDAGLIQEAEIFDAGDGLMSISSLQTEIKEGRVTDMAAVNAYLAKEAERFTIYKDQWNLTQIPMRKLTVEESAMVMKFKLEGGMK